MILFQLDPDSDEIVDVFLDREGLVQLRQVLERIERGNGHDHLMTPTWSGHELHEHPRSGGRLIHKVNVGLVPESPERTGV